MPLGRVYKICANDTEVYIGSTTKTLSQRFSKHKSAFKRYLAGKDSFLGVFTLFEKYGVGSCKIHLLQERFIVDENHLHAFEQLWINRFRRRAVNIQNTVFLGKKLWRGANKEQQAEYHKHWYEKHKEQRAEYHKQWYEKHKQWQREKTKQWREKNKGYNKQYYQKNKERINQRRRERRKEKKRS